MLGALSDTHRHPVTLIDTQRRLLIIGAWRGRALWPILSRDTKFDNLPPHALTVSLSYYISASISHQLLTTAVPHTTTLGQCPTLPH